MGYFNRFTRTVKTVTLLGLGLSLNACGTLSSPVDQAYYTQGGVFSTPGGYTRTIFSTSNF